MQQPDTFHTEIDSSATDCPHSPMGKKRRLVRPVRAHRPRERGMALVYATMTLAFLIPFVGLAIDSGIAFVIKTRLSIAVDSACLAAARSLSRGMDLASQEASARATALRYFYANFPTGDWRTTGADPVVVIQETGTRMRTVTVNAVRRAPLYFLPILGEHYADVGVVGQANRRDSNVILVLDRSGSMDTHSSTTPMKNAAVSFSQQFANGKDRMGLVVFSTGVAEAMSPTMYFLSSSPSITSRINSIVAGGGTNSTGALRSAYNMLVSINEPGAVNAIVFFTDGYPNGITSNFNNRKENGELDLLKSSSTCTNKTSDRVGLIAYTGAPSDTGSSATMGIYENTTSSLTQNGTSAISNSNGCYFRSDMTKMKDDVARLPYRDIWGNLTYGFTGHYAVTYTNVDNRRNMANASMNTVIQQVNTIRANATLKPVIYAIGLSQETGSYAIDPVFMKRLANTGDSSYYNSSQMEGLYIFVPINQQSSGLQEAFQRIASEILRLAL